MDALESPGAPLRIAISGAGIAGLTAAISLRKLPGVVVDLYEQAAAFREIGASIGLGPNGLRTLETLGVHNALREGVCIRQKGRHHQVYRHWRTGHVLACDAHRAVTESQHATARFHRAHLHAALLVHVPLDTIHLGKKTARIDVSGEDGLVLHFADGTSAHADLLIGADGIHSATRKWFVPHHKLHWTGWVAMRSTFDASLLDGVDFPDDAAHWVAPHRSFFHGRLGHGQFTTVGGFTVDPADPPETYRNVRWDDPGSLQRLRDLYRGWHPTVQALLEKTPYTRLYPNMAGEPLDTWVYGGGCVALIGDAAHTHGGAFAAGGSLAIDDAFCLLLALQHVWPATAGAKPCPTQIQHALRLFEATRLPHVAKVMTLARHQIIGKLAPGQKSEGSEGSKGSEDARRDGRAADDDEKLMAFIRSRPDTAWINEHSVEAAFREVVEAEAAASRVDRDRLPHSQL
ncbi:hypothetical protein SCUCBS95973_001683 [Sporothrix curviconia]|uniref:FAD-binding domain-containing protein n=1 Tax=Sporothrix curviconia TaxID=1260050 RepID=A0ABP0B0M5_9PEZI